MKIKEITTTLEAFAPLAWQEEYDNAGLTIGSPDTDVTSALICVDVTAEVLDEAEKLGAKLIISHHPLIFRPLKHLNSASNTEILVERAIRTGTALYACHTNLDRAPGGMSHALAKTLGLQKIEVLNPQPDFSSHRGLKPSDLVPPPGFGAIGTLPQPTPAADFLRHVATTLSIGCIRHSALPASKVKKIALSTGSGGSELEKAIAAGADVFLTADLRHDRFLAAAGHILLADIGHFESEFCAIDLIYDIISKKIPTFALHKSAHQRNPVNYLVLNHYGNDGKK
jgi:dinuclear metal center YbgI/SA1388 family protein